jgi:hypothetical protein
VVKRFTRHRRRRAPKLKPKQRAALALHLSNCTHPSQFVDNGRGEMERCPCYRIAMHAVRELGKPLTRRRLPMSRRDPA